MTTKATTLFSNFRPLLAASLCAALAAQQDQAPTPATQNQNPNAAATGAASEQDPAAQAAAAAAEQEQKKQEQEAKKQERIQKIQTVVFDRRPTTILRTWNSPPEKGVVNGETPPPGAAGQETAQAEGPAQSGEPAMVARGSASVTVMKLSAVRTSLPTSSAVVITGQPIAVAGGAPSAAAQPAQPAAPSTTDGPATNAGNAATAAATPVVATAAPDPTKPGPDPFDKAIVQWARAVTLSDWQAVKTFLASLESDDEKKAAWKHMLTALGQPPQDQNNKPFFAFADVIGLCAAAPLKKVDEDFAPLGSVLSQAMARGLLLEPMLEELRANSSENGEGKPLSRREAVKLLFGASQQIAAAEFLPDATAALDAADFEGLNLVAQSLVARHEEEGKAALLEQAWAALQSLFAQDDVDQKQKEIALRTAVGLAPRLERAFGEKWLGESFTRDVKRGMDILMSIGVAAAEAAIAQADKPQFRQMTLQLQQNAVTALLKAAPERAAEWRTQLSLLADNWLREVQATLQFDQSVGYGPSMRRDRFGNFFYVEDQQQNNGQAIAAAAILDLTPSKGWVEQLEKGMQPKFAMLTAQLWLKVQEEAKAFPFIAELAKTHPTQANELADEFLRVWTRNHDPNQGRNNYYFYGYEQRADGIPLTRSKQARNIEDLGKWVAELKKLPITGVDEKLLAQAFTTCHSAAEVYRKESIEKVFGSLGELEPRTLATLAQQMRANLQTVWRQPAVQEKNKTRRKQKDIEAEVQRGYEVARSVLDGGLSKHKDHWALLLVRAALQHDEIDYRRTIGNEVKFTEQRMAAFADFEKAADSYALAAKDLPKEEQSCEPFEHWFYAALGASDAQNISHEHIQSQAQLDRIKQKLDAMEGEVGQSHRDRFASMLFARMGNLNPAVKMRYAKAGIGIVGDNKQASEVKKLYDYYADLASEIDLVARIDGSTQVGHGDAFGLLVELRHTTDIERESGGFGRYLRNQNDISYSYNYGRPTENYRNKFAEAATETLKEHFEVLSITFQEEGVHSRATEQYGWRVTPYAYVMLKPRGPQIDRVPQLRLDLDFLDTSGYVVLPIETDVIAIDAKAEHGPARPAEKIEVTQILDERQAKDGKLVLEVKAQSRGLPPRLEELVTMQPKDFVLDAIDDSGPMVTRFDPDGANDVVIGERTWTINLKAKDGLPEQPTSFAFPTAARDGLQLVRQRYADADLVAAEPTVELMANYGKPRAMWPWWLAGAAVIALLAVAFMRKKPVATITAEGLRMPEPLTAFTAIGLLLQIRKDGAVEASAHAAIDDDIAAIERDHFADDGKQSLDLRVLATKWIERATKSRAS
jgi:hypothetical protein